MLFLHQPLMDAFCKWTNAEEKPFYNKEWKTVKVEELERFIGVTILIEVIIQEMEIELSFGVKMMADQFSIR